MNWLLIHQMVPVWLYWSYLAMVKSPDTDHDQGHLRGLLLAKNLVSIGEIFFELHA